MIYWFVFLSIGFNIINNIEFSGVKVLLSHGKGDPIIPYSMGEMVNSILKKGGAE